MKLLLNHNVDMEAKFEGKWTPLYCNAWCNSTDVAKLLLGHIADIKVRDMNNATPLHCNAWPNYKEFAAQVLLQHSVDIEAWNESPITPYYTLEHKKLDVVRFYFNIQISK